MTERPAGVQSHPRRTLGDASDAMPRIPRTQTLFIAITLLIFGVIAYLGFRTLAHEALRRHYQTQTLAQTRTEQGVAFVTGILQQKAAKIDAVMSFLQPDDATVKALRENDSDIEDFFVLRKNRLLYPESSTPLSQQEQAWVQTITPLVNDPGLLYEHSNASEGEAPRAGWFIIGGMQDPVLIYWHRREDRFSGFRVSYVKLLADVINAADFDFSPDLLSIKENGRTLYASLGDRRAEDLTLLQSIALPYPLHTWSVEYRGQTAGTRTIYLWGGILLLALLASVGLVMLQIYREYTRTARLARQQVDFVSQVSHELKTPLTNIALYGDLLREELGDANDEVQRHVDVIITEAQRLSRLIQNILAFTRNPKIHLQAVALGPLMAQVAQLFSPSFQAKQITLCVRSAEAITVEADADRLLQIIGNFLSNAEKYAADGKRVDLSVEAGAAHVDIHVRDYGHGISERDVKQIFQPFFRVKSEITEGVSGTGIGLTIARRLAESMHGEIIVTHPTPGVQFTLRLWREAQRAVEPAA